MARTALPTTPILAMPDNAFYYYDHETCTFKEVQPSRKKLFLKIGSVVSLACVLAALGIGFLSQVITSPAEVAQNEEIEALRSELLEANDRLETYADRVESLAETDRELYRTVLNAEPISEDEFQMGVGGTERNDYARFSASTSRLLRQTSNTFDRLERQLSLQSQSYDELQRLAARRDEVLRQQPAILPIKNARLTSGFGMRYHPILHVQRLHAGVDFPAAPGTPVYATADGTIRFSGSRGGYGNVVEINHPKADKMTRYAHLTRAAEGIRSGVAVKRGQVIGYTGNTGLSTAPHLHYEVRRLNEELTPLNPVTTFVPGVSPKQYQELVRAARRRTASFD